jgi:hypothetical protein
VIASGIMKQYVIDELRYQDYEKIESFLDQFFEKSSMAGIYWLPIGPGMLTEVQAEHRACQPYYVALDLEPERLSCELLVRSHNRMRCDCIGYADERQRNWIIDTLDGVLAKLKIIS